MIVRQEECVAHSGICLLPLPQSVSPLGRDVSGFDILRLALEWSGRMPDLDRERFLCREVVDRRPVERSGGQYVSVSSLERAALAVLVEEAAHAWLQDAVGEFRSPRQPEWAERVYDHLGFYVRCAYRQGLLP